MPTFFSLFGSIWPVYACILLGVIATKWLKCDKLTIAKILLYFLSPMVMFYAGASVRFSLQIALLPIVLFGVSCVLCAVSWQVLKPIFKDSRANLLAFSTSVGNSAYLGIPLAAVLLPNELVEVFVFTTLAAVLYQYSIGFLVTARGAYSLKNSLKMLAKLPIIYAFLAGLAVNFSGLALPAEMAAILANAKAALGLLGMMLIGMGCEQVFKKEVFDAGFLALAVLIKLIIHPILMLFFIWLDASFWGLLAPQHYIILFILSILPLTGNSVVIATVLGIRPQTMGLAVILTSIISLFSIPMMLVVYEWLWGGL